MNWKSALAGTTASTFQVGKGGPTLFQGSSDPSILGLPAVNGDLYVRTGVSAGLYQYVSGTWILRVDGGVNFSYTTIQSASTLQIPSDQEMIVFEELDIEGELDVEGFLVMEV